MAYTYSEKCRIWLQCAEYSREGAQDRLVSYFGSPESAFENFSEEDFARIAGKATCEALKKTRERGLDALEEDLYRLNAKAAFLGDPHYPQRLSLDAHPPLALFYKGVIPLDGTPRVAMVGSRKDTREGRERAFTFAKELAQAGVTVISGLASGIDGASHEGAVAANGRTAGVLGCGIARMYPKENEELSRRMLELGGALVSELPFDSKPYAFHFPRRNRLITGLSDALVIVEGEEKSGTSITLRNAREQETPVFTFPLEPGKRGSALPVYALRTGARCVTRAQDLTQDMGWAPPPARAAKAQASVPAEDAALFNLLKDGKMTFDALCAKTQLAPGDLTARLSMLEMDGLIRVLPGREYEIVNNS